LNNQYLQLGDGTPDWEGYLAKLESIQDLAVLGMTDYFTIEGSAYEICRWFIESANFYHVFITPTRFGP
jgi:hypothetical protein